jgi:hypothetical protein
VFPLQNKKTQGNAIVTKDQFMQNFEVFTESQLATLDWSNVFVAGGSVLGK